MQSADNQIVTGIKYAKAVTLSFFHPKEGPIVGFLFPRDVIANDIQTGSSEETVQILRRVFLTLIRPLRGPKGRFDSKNLSQIKRGYILKNGLN